MDPKFQSHVFICTRCSYENSLPDAAPRLRKATKKLAALYWDKKQVRINASGCLGQCERGISCVIYPQGKWLLELLEGDEGKIVEAIKDLAKP